MIKRRSVANEACDTGRVTVNDKPAKASYDVKEGDIIEIRFGERLTRAKVLSIAEHVAKNDAAALYEIV